MYKKILYIPYSLKESDSLLDVFFSPPETKLITLDDCGKMPRLSFLLVTLFCFFLFSFPAIYYPFIDRETAKCATNCKDRAESYTKKTGIKPQLDSKPGC